VYRLQRRGTSLDLQRNLMHPTQPLAEAWLAFLTNQAMGQPTYVLHDPHDGEAFVQVRFRPHQAAADVTCLAPSLETKPSAASAWAHLLDGAGIEAAGQGIQRVFASLPASGPEVDVFQQSGFTLYAEEDVYRRDPEPPPAATLTNPPGLRPQRVEDLPALQKLCVAITPQRVRQTEGGIGLTTASERHCHRHVLGAPEGDELQAALSICTGGKVHWMRILVHPAARPMANDLVEWGLGTLSDEPAKSVYCNVRQYENGTREALEAAGFQLEGTRALMVRHTVAWVKTPAPDAVPALANRAEVVPPAYRINGEPDLSGSDSRLAAETRTD
jgi:hypothetical protein